MVIEQTQWCSKTEQIWAKINGMFLCWHLKPPPHPSYADPEMEMDLWRLNPSPLAWKQKYFMLILAPASTLIHWTHIASKPLLPHFHFK